VFDWAVQVFDNAPMFIFVKRGHCDIVWYVESYEGLVFNSICKINSLGQESSEDSYKFVPFLLEFSSASSACSFLTLTHHPCPISLPSSCSVSASDKNWETEWAFCGGECDGSWSSWGSLHSGERVSLRGRRSRLMGAVGTDLRGCVQANAHHFSRLPGRLGRHPSIATVFLLICSLC